MSGTLLIGAQADGHMTTRSLLHLTTQSDAKNRVPKNIALSRRAYDFGLHFWRKGDLERALGAMNEALRFDPSYALAYAGRATVRSQRGDHRGAIEDASRAIELDPKLPEAYFNRAVAFGRLRDWGHAAEDYAQALRLAPTLGNGMAHNNLGSVLMGLGKLDEARQNFSRAIDLNPKNAISYFNRALANYRADNIDQAIADITATLELSEAFIKAHHFRAVLLIKKGLDREALEDLNTAIKLHPKDARALAERALLHERLGNKEAAELDFKLFSQISSEDPRKIVRRKHFLPKGSN